MEEELMVRRSPHIYAVAVLVAAILLVAGCGSSSKGAVSNSPTTVKATGTPIKIMISGVKNSTTLTLPEDFDAAMAHVQAVNAAGGVNGHPIEATECDTMEDPTFAASCAREAVANGDVAVVSTFTTTGSSFVPILQAAGIPYIDPGLFSTAEFTSPISFPLAGGAPVAFLGVGQELANLGCRQGAIIASVSAATAAVIAFVEASFKHAGGTSISVVNVSATQPDMAAAVAALQSDHAQCVTLVITTDEADTFFNALRESPLFGKIVVGSNSNVLDPNLIATEGSAVNGTIEIGAGHIPSDNVPAVAAAVKEIHQYQPNSPKITGLALEAWAATYLLLNDALPAVQGTVTAAKVKAALSSLSSAGTGGIFPPINFTTPNSVAAFSRVFNTKLLAWKIENSVPEPLNGGNFFSVSLAVGIAGLK
jgi:ABC-type branched-subunit amino acid transport system substrate-binding protein